MLRIGLTGGIASGKSEAVRCLAHHALPVVDTDLIAREVVAPGTPGLAAVTDTFGPTVLAADGTLDRSALRRRVFDDPAARRTLEDLLHPRIRAAASQRLAELAAAPGVVLVVPLLAEHYSVWRPLLDRVLLIDCDESTQFARLSARDAIGADLAHAMLAAQASRDQRRAIADDIVANDATPAILCQRLDALLDDWRHKGLLGA